MANDEQPGSPGWGASSFMQTNEDVARAVAAAATAVHSPRPSVVFSTKDENGDTGSPLQKLQNQFARVLRGISNPPEVRIGTYNPEILTSQKRQWAHFQLQHLDHRSFKEPTRLFESMTVVGLHPNCDIQALQKQYFGRKSEGSSKLRNALSYQSQSRVEPDIVPQILFAYPPGKQLPLKYKDLLSFCFPEGVEVHAVEKTPSVSELNQILLGQEHLKQSDMSFIFRLQVADYSTLYGCCVLVEELVQKPAGLLSLIADKQPSNSSLSRYVLTTRRCYCILSRLPFFELHFGVLNSIFTQERLDRLTKSIEVLNLEPLEVNDAKEISEVNSDSVLVNQRPGEDIVNRTEKNSLSLRNLPAGRVEDDGNHLEHQKINGDTHMFKEGNNYGVVIPVDHENDMVSAKGESDATHVEDSDIYVNGFSANKQVEDRRLPSSVLSLLHYYQYESSESSSSFQGSPCEDRYFRSDIDDTETGEASFSGQEDSNDLLDILEWAKANNRGSLQIICEYYQLSCPSRGSTLSFHPLEHLHPLEYHRPHETVLHIAGSTVDMKSCRTSLEFAEAHNALLVEEEATALSIWTVACICGSLRLENVLSLFAGALLEKQIAVVCSNLGILSASVLSVIPLIRPYQWQSLLMPVLPNDMLDFLDAPVPYIVGVKNKTNEVQSKLANVILVDVNKNQVKSQARPQLPKQKELFSSLRPYHSKLVGESYLGRKRPVYECTDVQVEAAKGFLSVLRSYLDSLCTNLRSHTITNVQSNDDKVSLLLKESFIDSFPYRDRPFMKLFVDTQLFSVHTDFVLSFFQKE
ncbi:DENN domain containing protein [Quillaja saponaria]|uniref:DENN domain containing protein n=1 Tax=Quillaja saponaria TaxID=32244 RepID=A0AAD7VKR3_QUISA|nr:DENN domain containing protein [Quillaja saponaria]KAJ7979256.1 DENN domain containing protein [Quillaja saponaria]